MNFRQPDVITVAVSRVDGGVTVLRVIVREYIPDPKDPTKRVVWKEHDPTPAYIGGLIAKYVNDGHWVGGLAPTGWELVPNDYLDEQTDKTFRNAWTHTPGRHKPDTDMPKAREIHREHLRVLRTPLLESLDLEDIKAVEEGLVSPIPHVNLAKRKAIVERKQALRDITQHSEIEAATTPDELKVAAVGVLNG
jgi:hypothetical protein